MNTTNHKKLSKVGEALVKAALKHLKRGEMRIGAMELGNWLTDVSQTVDRVAYQDVHEKVGKGVHAAGSSIRTFGRSIQGIFQRLQYVAPSWIDPLLQTAEDELRVLRGDIEKAEERLLNTIQAAFEDGGRLENAFRAAFGFVGFFKHAYPLDGTGRYRIDPDCYFHVFEKRFTEYLPHEHLDRAEQIAFRQNPKNSKLATKTERGLYEYLRRDMKAAAGLFALLDGGPKNMPADGHSWAEATFSPTLSEFYDESGKHQVSDQDPAWNLNLAMLGHALHGVEDFFGHSTFVEHASRALPEWYCRAERWEDAHVGPDRTAGEWNLKGPHVLERRLKKWKQGFDDNTEDWRKLDPDQDIVTGYFDFNDTFISLTHALDELFERPSETVGKTIDKTWTKVTEYQYRKLLEDTLEFFSDPKTVWKNSDPSDPAFDEEKENLAAKLVREKMGKNLKLMEGSYPPVNVVVQLILDGPLAKQPQKVKDNFKTAAELFSRAAGAGMAGYTLYKAVKQIAAFFADPLAWLGKILPEKAYAYLKKYGEVYLKNTVWELVGSQRIGCHSLIAKDSGRELFFEGGMECARAAHWYVIHTLLRHSRTRPVAVARATKGGSANAIFTRSWVDWMDLLEYWLDHPFAKMKVEKRTTRVFSGPIRIKTRRDPSSVMSPDSLESLAREYGGKTFDRKAPGAPEKLTWETIADANFPVVGLFGQEKARRINNILRQDNKGILVSDQVNYAFRPDLPLTIPFQKFEVQWVTIEEIERKWWYAVLTDKNNHYKTVAAWFDENGIRSAKAPSYAYYPKYLKREEHQQLVESAGKLRAELVEEYRGLRKATGKAP